jgi:ribose transport system substrate-binding protein
MGEVAASKWMEFHPDKPIVYAVIGWMENPVVQVERTEPFIAGVKSVAPNAKEAALLDAAAGTEKAYEVCQDLLQSHPEVNIIYSEAANLTLGVLPALEEAGRGVAVDGVPVTEILVSTDAPETELRDIYDPTKSLKVTMGLTPKDNAIARIDNLFDIYTGKTPQDEFLVIETYDKEIDYWNTSAAEAAAWFNEQYDGNISLD